MHTKYQYARFSIAILFPAIQDTMLTLFKDNMYTYINTTTSITHIQTEERKLARKKNINCN